MGPQARRRALLGLFVGGACAAVLVLLVVFDISYRAPGYHEWVVPRWRALADAVHGGNAPGWWHDSGLGRPLAGSWPGGAMYPASWLATSRMGIDLVHWLHVFLGAAGLAVWARRMQPTASAAPLAFALVVTSPLTYVAAASGAVAVIAWLPWLAAASLRLRQRPAGTAVLAMAAGLALLALAGFWLAVAAGLLWALVTATTAVPGQRVHAIVGVVGASLLGTALAGVAWVPSLLASATDPSATAGAWAWRELDAVLAVVVPAVAVWLLGQARQRWLNVKPGRHRPAWIVLGLGIVALAAVSSRQFAPVRAPGLWASAELALASRPGVRVWWPPVPRAMLRRDPTYGAGLEAGAGDRASDVAASRAQVTGTSRAVVANVLWQRGVNRGASLLRRLAIEVAVVPREAALAMAAAPVASHGAWAMVEIDAVRPRVQWHGEVVAVDGWPQALANLVAGVDPRPRLELAAAVHAAHPPVDAAPIACTWQRLSPRHVRSVCPRSGWVVWAGAWAPGWRAQSAGQPTPIWPADGLLMATWSDDGTVDWRYHVAGERTGAWISLAGLMAALAFSVGQRWRRRAPSR